MALQILNADWERLDERAARGDRLVFYAATISSFLEISIQHYTTSLREIFANEPEVVQWLVSVWEPEERAHGDAMRVYLARVWPQYNWGRAYAGFVNQYAPLCNVRPSRPTPAREMLARCVTECEAASLYRALASVASDPLAKHLFNAMYEDEISHYKFFFRWFRILRERENLGTFSVFSDTLSRQRKALNEDVGTALVHVSNGFVKPMPFAPLEPAALMTMAQVAWEDHSPFDTARAIMLKPLRACSGLSKPLASAVDIFTKLGQRMET